MYRDQTCVNPKARAFAATCRFRLSSLCFDKIMSLFGNTVSVFSGYSTQQLSAVERSDIQQEQQDYQQHQQQHQQQIYQSAGSNAASDFVHPFSASAAASRLSRTGSWLKYVTSGLAVAVFSHKLLWTSYHHDSPSSCP